MIDLSKNENTIISHNLADVISQVQINKYSFLDNHLLHAALAKRFNEHKCASVLSEDNFILGAGSSDVIFMLFNALNTKAHKEGKTLHIKAQWPTFEIVLDYARALGAKISYTALLDGEFSNDEASENDLLLHYVCNPNNPTGKTLNASDLAQLQISAQNGEWVILDEAYAELNPEHLSLALASENVLHVRTFSKAFGLAGARCGYGIGSLATISLMNAFYNPDRINSYALHAALYALEQKDFIPNLLAQLMSLKKQMFEFLDREQIAHIKGAGNFILHEIKDPKYVDFMKEQGILVGGLLRTKTALYNRISVGNQEQVSAVLSAWAKAKKLNLL